MENKRYILIIILLLLVKGVVSLVNNFSTPDSIVINNSLYLFYKLADIAFILYLYRYITVLKGERISLISVVLIIAAILYFITVKFLSIQIDKSNFSTNEIFLYQFFTSIFPFILLFIGQLYISIQLIRNNINSRIGKAVKIVGVTLMVEILSFILIPLLTLPQTHIIFGIIVVLPIMAMINLYLNELKIINSSR
jgi:hypothetical protein